MWLRSSAQSDYFLQIFEFGAKAGLHFYFLFTIVMKVLISCTENPKIFIVVLDELELFIDKKVIFDEKKFLGPFHLKGPKQIFRFDVPIF
jgi:hypothetical protein